MARPSTPLLRERELQAIDHFEAALQSEYGVEVEIVGESATIEEVLQYYYFIRKADERYMKYSLIRAPGAVETKFWIVRRHEELDNKTYTVPPGR